MAQNAWEAFVGEKDDMRKWTPHTTPPAGWSLRSQKKMWLIAKGAEKVIKLWSSVPLIHTRIHPG